MFLLLAFGLILTVPVVLMAGSVGRDVRHAARRAEDRAELRKGATVSRLPRRITPAAPAADPAPLAVTALDDVAATA